MSSICGESPNNNFCTCINTSNPDYIQYNANGLDSGQGAGSQCCNLINMTPDILHRIPETSEQIGSTSEFLNYFNNLEYTPCDYTKYFGGYTPGTSDCDLYLKNNYSQLFTFAERQRQIYNVFYVIRDSIYPSSVTTNDDLVPVVSGNTITAPEGCIPLIFNYEDGVHSESQYLFIVWPIGREMPQFTFPNTYLYFFDINGSNCKINYCTTLYSPTRGVSFSNTGPGNGGTILDSRGVDMNSTIILICVISALLLIFSGLLIWDSYRYKKKPIMETTFKKIPPPKPRGGL